MLNERFGISRMSEGHENAIWQCPEIYTCQTVVKLKDNRTEDVGTYDVFFTFTENDDPRDELERIVSGLGFSNCGIVNQFCRKTSLDAFALHQSGKPISE